MVKKTDLMVYEAKSNDCSSFEGGKLDILLVADPFFSLVALFC